MHKKNTQIINISRTNPVIPAFNGTPPTSTINECLIQIYHMSTYIYKNILALATKKSRASIISCSGG